MDICRTLKRFPALQNLELRLFPSNEITDKGIEALVDCLRNLPSLADLGLSFSDCPGLTKKYLDYIVQFLKGQHCLKTVDLWNLCDNPEITREHADAYYDEIENVRKEKPNLRITACPG